MKLQADLTSITVEEQAVRDMTLTDPYQEKSVEWIADLDGQTEDGMSVRMSRSAGKPDEAIKALFEAMTEAEITL